MSQPSKSVQRVRSIRLASPKKTLILEAEPDRKVYEFWLGQLASGLPAALSKVDLILPRQESFASLHILTRRASEGAEALPSLGTSGSYELLGARVYRSVSRTRS